MTWNIVSDSSCDLRTASFHSSCVRFETVPLRIQVGGREFVDDDALSVPALLSARAGEKAASSSACPLAWGDASPRPPLPLPRRLCRGL